MSAPHFCPGCGLNMTADQIINRNGWEIDPHGPVSYQGVPVKMSIQMAALLHTLASSTRPVQVITVANRIAVREVNPETVRVQVSRIRKLLRTLGIPDPIGVAQGFGYVWQVGE